MNKTKFYLTTTFILIVSLFVGFYACSSDDTNLNFPGKQPAVTGSVIKKLDISYGHIPALVADINYTGKQPTSCKISNSLLPIQFANVTVTYEGDKIILSSKGSGSEEDLENGWDDNLMGDYIFTYTIKDGYAISCESKVKDTETDNFEVYANTTLEYNNGYLSKITVNRIAYWNTPGSVDVVVLDLKWYQGDLIKFERKYTSSYGIKETDEYIVIPSKIENKNKFPVDFYALAADLMGTEFNFMYASYLDIFGNTPNNYPSSINFNLGYGDEQWRFEDYVLDNNSNIISARIDNGDDFDFRFKFGY